MKSKLTTSLAAAGFALALSVGAARADTTFDVSATFVPSGVNGCAGCTLGGNIVIDTTSGSLTSGHVTKTGLSVGPFTSKDLFFLSSGLISFDFLDAFDNAMFFFLPVSTLTGYTGGSICGAITVCAPQNLFSMVLDANFVNLGTVASGSLTPAPVPIPAVGAGLPGLVAAFGLLTWWRRRKNIA
jgi:hypothetical protein